MALSSKRILVAGGCGFIGSHLVDRLLSRSDVERCVVVDNLWTGALANIAHVHDSRLSIVHGDVERFQSDRTFDEIYHLASPASPPWYMAQPARTISANLVGAMRLLELLKPGGRFSFTSTSGGLTATPCVSTTRELSRLGGLHGTALLIRREQALH